MNRTRLMGFLLGMVLGMELIFRLHHTLYRSWTSQLNGRKRG